MHVVETGSFSAAARRLGVTPSAVSRQVSQLEEELGARLFHRTTRKQVLTEAGDLYYAYASRIAQEIDVAHHAVGRLSRVPSGTLHVTAEPDLAATLIAPLMPRFLDRYPEITLRFSMSSALVDLVGGGIDLAIRMGHLEDSSLIARRIAVSRSRLYASPGYLTRRGTPSHPSELSRHDCLSFRTCVEPRHWHFETEDGPLGVQIEGPVNVDSLIFLRSLAVAGRGIVQIPSWIVGEATRSGKLVPLLDEYPLIPPATPISAIFSHNRQLAPKVRVFVDFLGKHIDLA